LAQENRRREIAEALRAPRARVAAAETELKRQRAAVQGAQDAERQGRAERQAAERAREQAVGRLAGCRAALAEAEARAQAMRASIERMKAEGEAARAEAAAAAEGLAALPDPGAAAAEVGAARTAAERARGALAEARATAAGIDRAQAEAEARIARLSREVAEWEARDRAAEAAATVLEGRIQSLGADRAGLVAEPAARDARLALVERDLSAAEAARAAAGERVLAAEMMLADLDRQARAADTAVGDGREARATAAATASQARALVEGLAADAESRFGMAPGGLPVPDGEAPPALEARLADLVAERERLGVVNLRADIELAEIEAALGRQAAEKAELDTAIARLRGSIGSLNREGRARLLEAFQAVDRHFRDLFVTLFGGGAAELSLVESDDPLEAGLEIRAQPPGKKLQSLSLLSGGEQALTAIALVFALFLTNPAPICVLDEVDAPLDDANVERFTRLLHHMAEMTDTRFLIVTHNAVTMAAMHRLYGVTMAEPGVSQLVSVDLEAATGLREAA
jgi:chromosome segregation protein